MLKKVFLLALLFASLKNASAQKAEKPAMLNKEDSLKYGWWTRGSSLGLNISGSAFSANTKSGGVNNIGLVAMINNKAVHTKGKGIFTSDLQAQIGFLDNFTQNSTGTGKTQEFKKNLDRLFFDNKYAKVINPKLNWYVGVNLLSQFLNGFDYSNPKKPLISSFLSPAFLSEGIGLEYKATPHLTLSFGGATLRQTFVFNEKTWNKYDKDGVLLAPLATDKAFGVERGKNMLFEAGFSGVAAYDRNLTKNINLKGRWQSFWAYAPTSKPVDHNFALILTAKVNKYINFNAMLNGIYDQDAISKSDKTTKNLKSIWQYNAGGGLGFSMVL